MGVGPSAVSITYTYSALDNVGNWAAYDAGANGVGTDPDGFIGGVFDGRYIYFVPFHNGTAHHGEVLRYDAKIPASVPDTVYGGSFL